MHRKNFPSGVRRRLAAVALFSVAFSTFAETVAAQATRQTSQTSQTSLPSPTSQSPRLSLVQAFEAAWSQQPEQAALAARRDAVRAQQQAAQSWTPEPAAIEVGGKSDRLNRNAGTREFEAGVAIPLWLPGERSRSLALAQAEGRVLESRVTAARLRVAAAVREAWWNWLRARADTSTAQGQLIHLQDISADVNRRLKAGDLAQADLHQADGAVAAAQAGVAQADAAVITAEQALRALVQWPDAGFALGLPDAGAEPAPDAALADLDAHVDLLALKDRARVAEGVAALAATQTRASPELTVTTTRDRGASGEAWQQTFRVGVRMPLGASPRQDVRTASARADLIELQAQLKLERARLLGERTAAQARSEAARLQRVAADRRAQLALESRGFFDKSFRLGETDLPTRLRIEAEAAESERQAARARIEEAAAISAWRQALGLLPL